MAKRRGRKAVERSRYREYMNVAEHFYGAAKDSMELEYWTAAGLLIVHSAIAFADALCIKLSGQKSAGENQRRLFRCWRVSQQAMRKNQKLSAN